MAADAAGSGGHQGAGIATGGFRPPAHNAADAAGWGGHQGAEIATGGFRPSAYMAAYAAGRGAHQGAKTQPGASARPLIRSYFRVLLYFLLSTLSALAQRRAAARP